MLSRICVLSVWSACLSVLLTFAHERPRFAPPQRPKIALRACNLFPLRESLLVVINVAVKWTCAVGLADFVTDLIAYRQSLPSAAPLAVAATVQMAMASMRRWIIGHRRATMATAVSELFRAHCCLTHACVCVLCFVSLLR